MRIRTKAARGLAMGTASHALGTARCAELDYQEGAFSSLALVLCGIITSADRAVPPDYSGSNGLKFAMRRAFFDVSFTRCIINEIQITYKAITGS